MSAELGRQILEAVKGYVAGRFDALATRIAEAEAALRALPKPERGEKGEPGEKGERGEDGKSPSAEELQKLIEPLIPAPIPGERGKQGERGETGLPPSESVLRSIIAPLIPAPIPGEKGERGEKGEKGEDGRDALAVELLPQIDEAKSYARGSYAKHAGGLWRAFETTHGMRGWECLLEGIASESESLGEDGRTITRKTVYSSGRVFERSFAMAVVLDKGVYKPEASYVPGDAVTWGGSIWIAQKHDGDYSKPGTPGSGWRLAVKAGRDGRPL